jgi:hypothetical protein
MSHNLPESQRIWHRITTVFLDALQDKSGLFRSQECIFVRKFWDEQPGRNANEKRDCTLDDLGRVV